MNNIPEPLQNFTDSEIENLIQKKIDRDTFDQFPDAVKDRIARYATQKFNASRGAERDRIWNNIQGIITSGTKSQGWEFNHFNIIVELTKKINEFGRLPSITELSQATGFSRVTISKHLKEYKASPEYELIKMEFEILRQKVLGQVFKFAIEGNIAAARLFMELTAPSTNNASIIKNQQNNFVQIVGTVIKEEHILKLPLEKQIELQSILSLIGLNEKKFEL